VKLLNGIGLTAQVNMWAGEELGPAGAEETGGREEVQAGDVGRRGGQVFPFASIMLNVAPDISEPVAVTTEPQLRSSAVRPKFDLELDGLSLPHT
jgi:hypothetical protein